MQRKLPKWLPQAAADLSGEIVSELPPALLRRRKRLMTDSRMEFVWRRLEQEKRRVSEVKGPFQAHPDHITAAVDAFLRGFLYAAISADTTAEYWKGAPGAREQRLVMSEIGQRALELLNLLGDRRCFKKWTPWDRLTAAIPLIPRTDASLQALLKDLAKQTHGRHWSDATPAERQPRQDPRQGPNKPLFPREARVLLGDLPSQLKGLAALAELSAADAGPRVKPPRKTKQLQHTVYARNLARYAMGAGLLARQSAHRQAGFPFHQVIAITANVALELSGGDALRPDTVRKIVADER